MILSLDEALRLQICESMNATTKAFRRSIRPIYCSLDGTRAEPIGSCLLLNVDDRKVLVTAAHVLDATSSHALYVLGLNKTKPVQLLGKLTSTSLPQGGRQQDKLDIGLWEVTEMVEYKLGGVTFVSENECSSNRISSNGRIYMVMGYPHSRNKRKVNLQGKTITPVIWKYSGSIVKVPELSEELGIFGESHYFLKYEKHSTDFDGRKVFPSIP